jgi:hypothetical protein
MVMIFPALESAREADSDVTAGSGDQSGILTNHVGI